MTDQHPLTTFSERHLMPLVAPTAGRAELCQLFKDLGFTRGAEIGVWTGEFSQRLCQTIPGLQLTCVDPWRSYDGYVDPKNDPARLEAAYAEACARLAPFRCEIRRMSSLEAASQTTPRSLDFVYLDGNHGRQAVIDDLETWTLRIRHGGILAGHDFFTSKKHRHIEVEAAVREFVARHAIVPWFVLAADKCPSYFWMVK